MEIVVALISGLCVAIPSLIATIVSNNKSSSLIQYRIDKLEEKVNLHNQLIDRMYKVESRLTLLEDEMKKRRDKL